MATRIREGQRQRLHFVADQVGDHRFGSCEWDGTALHVMKGRLRVRPPLSDLGEATTVPLSSPPSHSASK